MKSEITKEGSPKKKYRLYIFAAFLAVIMALSCVAIFAADSDDVAAEGNVAKIGTTEYATLADAVVAATGGDKIVLINSVSLTSTVVFDKELTLDLAGYNITATNVRAILVKAGSLDIIGEGTISAGGNIVDSSSVIRIGDNTGDARDVSLTIGENVTVSTDKCYGITIFGNKTTETLTINGTVETTAVPAISGNGSTGYGNTTITIGETAVISTVDEYAIYHPQSGTLTINGTVTGKGGVELKAGATNVQVNGEITATATSQSHSKNNDGTSTSGYAIAVVENSGYAGGATVTVPAGTVNGVIIIIADDAVSEEKKGSIILSGGSYSVQPDAAYVASGYFVNADAAGTFSVVSNANAVAQIGEVKYATLEDAIVAANSGDTVVILKDCSVAGEVTVSKNITLDLNGFKISGQSVWGGTSTSVIHVTAGKLIILDSVGGGKIIDTGVDMYYAIIVDNGAELELRSGTIAGDYGGITSEGSVVISGGSITTSATTSHTMAVMSRGAGGSVEVTGGTFTADYGFQLLDGSSMEISGGTITADYGISLFKDASVTVSGTTKIIAESAGISSNGTVGGAGDASGARITVTGGDITGNTGIYAPSANGVTVISGGKITGEETAIEIRAGSLEISGDATLICNSTPTSSHSNGSGTTTVGAAVAVAQHTTAQPISVTITGGVFTAPDKALYMSNPENNSAEDIAKVAVSITGGTFNGDVGNVQGGSLAITGGSFKTDINALLTEDYTAELVGEMYVVKRVYAITIDSEIQNGTVAAAPLSGAEGTEITLTITPAPGYQLKEGSLVVTGTGGNVTVTNNKFAMPAYDVTVTAEFELISYDVAYNITNAQPVVGGKVNYHAAFESVTITPNEHYVVPASVTVTMGGAEFTQFTYENGKVTIAAGLIEGDIVITGECALQTYTVTFGVAGNGTVDVTSVTAPYGSAFAVDGDKVTINGTTVTVTVGADTEKYTYTLEGWNVKNGDTVAGDTAVAAIVTEFTKPTTSETAVEFISDSGDVTVTASVDDIKASDKDNVIIGKDTADDKWSVELPKSYFSDKSDSVSVTVTDVSSDLPSTITLDQKEKLEGMTVIALDMVIGDKTEHQFGSKVTVKLAYTLKAGESADNLFVYYVNTDTGALDKYEATYADGFVSFETDHFSYWAVGGDIDNKSSFANDGLFLAALLVAAIVAPIIVALVYFRKH